MRTSLLFCLAVLCVLPAFGQSARQLTRRIAPYTQPAPPPAPPGNAGAISAAGAAGAAAAAPADPAKVAAEKKKTESDLIKYYKSRAEAGSDSAQYELGLRYIAGNGVERDEKLGREWIEKSAKAGNPKAVKMLEQMGPVPAETKEAKPASAAQPAK